MPANLPPQYYELERAFREEKDTREKLRMAEELLRIMPKHKGTDKLQADMKAKISKLKKQLEGGEKSPAGKQATGHDYIEKEGAAQVLLVGPPNSGKSSLLESLTHAKPLVADYPFSTREPMTGMMNYEAVQFQLIDTPPIAPEHFENYLSGLIRNADLIVLVADLGAESLETDLKYLLEKLEEKRIHLKPRLDEVIGDPRLCIKKTIICAHKMYEDESGERLGRLKQLFPEFTIVITSIIDDDSLNGFRKTVFDAMGIIRVFTKPIGHEPDFEDPIILPIGANVEAAARTLHKDFAQNLKFARIWGKGRFDGQRVQLDFQLSDGDIVEFHM